MKQKFLPFAIISCNVERNESIYSFLYFLSFLTVRGSLLTNDRIAEFLTRTTRHDHVPTAMISSDVPQLPDNIDIEYVCANGGLFYLQYRVHKEWQPIVVSEVIQLVDTGAYFDCEYLLLVKFYSNYITL
jgi:hypothetical protein